MNGDIDELARQLFVRGPAAERLFYLSLDDAAADTQEDTLAQFCIDLVARGSLRLFDVRDPTRLTPAQFAELAACMLRAGLEIAMADAVDRDAFMVSVSGEGGIFRARVRVTHPRLKNE